MIIPGAPIEISLSDLLEQVSEEEIVHKYVLNFKSIDVPFISEFRFDRRGTSCRIFKNKSTGNLMYKDFADHTIPTQINIIEYVAIKFKIDFQAAINKIAIDFGKIAKKDIYYDNVKKTVYFNKTIKEKSSSDLIIKIKKRNWTKKDIEYWNKYSIPISLLERNNIKSISHIWLYRENKKIFSTEFSDNHLVFSYNYYWSNNVFRRKIYRPFSENFKWISNTDYTIVQNYPHIPKYGDLLFIQSSYKDCIVMELMGYYAIAPNAESTWMPLKYWEKIKKKWKKIIIFGNNDWEKEDNPGLSYAMNHSKRYGVPYIVIPDGETSDISDYVKRYSLEEAKKLTEKLIYDIYK